MIRETGNESFHTPFPEPRPLDASLAEVLRFLRRNLVLVLCCAVFAGTMTALALLFLVAPSYEAAATLVVAPPTFKSELKPPALSVQGYQRILESDAVIAETHQHLVDDGVLESGGDLRLGRDLKTRIFVSRRAEETALAPVIEAVGYGRSADRAAAIANTWSRVFLERSRSLLIDNVTPTLKLIEDQYHAEREKLQALNQEWRKTATEYQERVDALATTWDKKLVDARKETEDLVAGYHTDTRRALQALVDERRVTDQVDDPELSKNLQRTILKILSLRILLAQAPRFLVLEKAVSDDVLWQAIAFSRTQGFDLSPVLGQRLVTQEANPIHDDLVLRLNDVELELEDLSPPDQQEIQALSGELETAQIERQAGLAKLIAGRDLAVDTLKKQRRRELEALQQERNIALATLDQDIQNQQDLYTKLASSFNEVTLARASNGSQDVRLGTPAVAPSAPERRVLFKTVVAAAMGALVGLLLALVREAGAGRALVS